MPSLTTINSKELKNYYFTNRHVSINDVIYIISSRGYKDLPISPSSFKTSTEQAPKILGIDLLKGEARYSAPLHNLFSNYKSLKSNITNFKETKQPLPIAVRYVSESGHYFIERFPFQKTIDLSNHLRKQSISKDDNITIWIPWSMAVVSTSCPSEFKLFYSHQSLNDENDTYVAGLFPNSYSKGGICFGQSTYQYPEIFQPDSSTERVDVRSIYSTLFNEYFDAGWNTDLSPHIFHNLVYRMQDIKSKKSIYPSLYNFLFPDQEIIKKLPNISKSKLKILVSPSLRSHTPLQQHIYTLLMLSTMSLEETLQFCKEYTSFLEKYSFEHTSKFKELTLNIETDKIAGSLPMNYLIHAPVQANKNLESNIKFEDTIFRSAYVFCYDSRKNNIGFPQLEYNFLYSKDSYIEGNFENCNKMYKDYLDSSNSKADKNIRDVYLVDINGYTWEKLSFDITATPECKNSDKVFNFSEESILASYYALKKYCEKFLTPAKVNVGV